MTTNRLFTLLVAIALLTVIAVTVQAALPAVGSTYQQSKEEAQREYELGERYGQIPPLVVQFSAEEIAREYLLGERYGVTPQDYAMEQALREYWLGERYGQTP